MLAREALEAQEAQGLELEERTEMEGGKGGRARGERRFWGSPPGFLASCAGSTCGFPERGSEGEVGNPPRRADRILLWKNGEPSPRGMCGAGRWRGARVGRAAGRGVSYGVPLKGFPQSCPAGGDSELNGVWG